MIGSILGAACVFALKLPLFRYQGLNFFGVLNLIYVDLVVLLPVLAIALLVLSVRSKPRNRRLSRPATIVCWLTMLAIPIGIYATFVEPYRLQLETADVPVLSMRAGKTPIRIGVLADIQINHVSDYEREAVHRLMAERPDLILIPGDIFQASMEQFESEERALRDLFQRLNAPAGVFLVLGDVDWSMDVVRRILEGSRVKVLFNESTSVRFADRTIVIGGVELKYDSDAARRLVHEMEESPGDDDVRILLTHRPDVALGLRSRSRIDLVVAGHTHGGQVVVPFLGPPMTLSQVPRHIAAGGLHRIKESMIYISRGVGCEHGQAPRIRFLCPPEISVLTVGADRENR